MQRATFLNGSKSTRRTKTNIMKEQDKKGLGDVTKQIIHKVLPKTAKKLEDCEGCERRRKLLNKAGKYLKNNFNAKFG